MRVLLITIMVAAGIGICLYNSQSGKYHSDTSNYAMTMAMQTARQKSDKILESFNAGLRPVEARPEAPAPGSQLNAAFEPWISLKSSLNKREARARIVRTLATKPGIVDLPRNILQDTDLAKGSFGENQAVARIIAIEILLEEARNLNPEPLRETLLTLNRKFSERDPDMGQRQDLEDLLSGYFQILIPDFPEGLEFALEEIGFAKNLETIFMVAGLNNSGRQHYNQAMRILKHHFES